MLFNLGKAISGPPTNNGNKKLPNPPIIAGITIKNIITIACAVIIELYNWLSAMYCTPGPDSSIRIKTEKAVPTNPENIANIRYNVPISLALDDKNHLSFHIVILLIVLNKLLVSLTELFKDSLVVE
jgi:hypothetical protein